MDLSGPQQSISNGFEAANRLCITSVMAALALVSLQFFGQNDQHSASAEETFTTSLPIHWNLTGNQLHQFPPVRPGFRVCRAWALMHPHTIIFGVALDVITIIISTVKIAAQHRRWTRAEMLLLSTTENLLELLKCVIFEGFEEETAPSSVIRFVQTYDR